jgi:hypothetical protein
VQYDRAIFLSNWAKLANRQGEYKRARTQAEEALALFRERRDSAQIPYALHPLMEASFRQDDLAQATALAE